MIANDQNEDNSHRSKNYAYQAGYGENTAKNLDNNVNLRSNKKSHKKPNLFSFMQSNKFYSLYFNTNYLSKLIDYNIIDYIEKVSKHKPKMQLFYSRSYELCTITSLKTVANVKQIFGTGFLILYSNRLVYYMFNPTMNTCIEIDYEDIENFIFLDCRQAYKKSKIENKRKTDDSADGMTDYAAKSAKKSENFDISNFINHYLFDLEIPNEYISFSLCLKHKPAIYKCEYTSQIREYLKNYENIDANLTFFESLEWSRVTASEYSDLDERFDIKFNIPITQLTNEFTQEHLNRIVNIYLQTQNYTPDQGEQNISSDYQTDWAMNNLNDSSKNSSCFYLKENSQMSYNNNFYSTSNFNCNRSYESKENTFNSDINSLNSKPLCNSLITWKKMAELLSQYRWDDSLDFSKKELNLTDTLLESILPFALKAFHLNLILKYFSDSHFKIVNQHQIAIEPKISLADALKYFSTLDFDSYFYILSFISKKGRFLVDKFTESNLKYIYKQDMKTYIPMLSKSVAKRFEEFSFILETNNGEPSGLSLARSALNFLKKPLEMSVNSSIAFSKSSSNAILIRSVSITPLSIIYDYEFTTETNRVTRHFDPDKFCKVFFRNENGKDLFAAEIAKISDNVYEHFRSILLKGLQIGTRKYFFLVMTTSQLKVHGSWFITPHEIKLHPGTKLATNILIGSDYIKAWIGDFKNIKNIGKYAVRMGMALSSTVPSVDVTNYVEVKDVEKNGYLFTDGIGLINRKTAEKICKHLNIAEVPSAFQIRFAGFKGVITVHPWMDDPKALSNWYKKNMPHKIINGSEITLVETKNNESQIEEKLLSKLLQSSDLILRQSMNKYESTHRNVEILNSSKSCDFYLNRQIIQILEGLNVNPQVFIDLQDRHIYNTFCDLLQNFKRSVKVHCPLAQMADTDFEFYKKIQYPIINNVLAEINSKANILIPEGRGAMGVIDELDLLKADEIFCMFSKRDIDENYFRNNDKNRCLVDYGNYFVPICSCIMAKNPVMHPGDIRLVKCVDIPALHYLKDVIVFSKDGDRPIFNQCSGSDLDGDIFFISWLPSLIPKALFKPYKYQDSNALVKERVISKDIVNFYIKHMRYYSLGQIAFSFMAMADKYSIFDPKSLKLSEIFNKSIDYVKTGNLVSIPNDLVPEKYPDFMNKIPKYKSDKVLGRLYRRSRIDFSDINFCECMTCQENELIRMHPWKEFIILGHGIVTKQLKITLNDNPLDSFRHSNDRYSYRQSGARNFNNDLQKECLAVYKQYSNEIFDLLSQYHIKTEEELFCNADCRLLVNELVAKYKPILQDIDFRAMCSVIPCNGFKSIEPLLKNAFKIPENTEKMIYLEGTSDFIFNPKIHLLESTAYKNKLNVNASQGIMNIEFSNLDAKEADSNSDKKSRNTINVEFDLDDCSSDISDNNNKKKKLEFTDFYKNDIPIVHRNNEALFYSTRFHSKEIAVLCNIEKYYNLISNMIPASIEVFKELFNLSLLSGLYQISEIDALIDLFTTLYDKMKISLKTLDNKKLTDKELINQIKIRLLTVAIPNSSDSFFKILCLIPLDFTIIKKCQLLREKSAVIAGWCKKMKRLCKRACVIISGMLDENEEIEFVKTIEPLSKNKICYVPVLRNKGQSSPDYYKDTLRDFIVNILYSRENSEFLSKFKAEEKKIRTKTWTDLFVINQREKTTKNDKAVDESDKLVISDGVNITLPKSLATSLTSKENVNSLMNGIGVQNLDNNEDRNQLSNTFSNTGHLDLENKTILCHISNRRGLYELVFTPGRLIFTSISPEILNESISVKTIENILSRVNYKKSFEFDFINKHDTLESDDKKQLFLQKVGALEETIVETLSFIFEDQRYDIEYTNSTLKRITKGKKSIGRSFIVNNSVRNDLKCEIFRRELIYSSEVNLLTEKENFMTDKLISLINTDKGLDGQDKLTTQECQYNYHLKNTFNCSKLKLERSIIYSNKDGFTLSRVSTFGRNLIDDISHPVIKLNFKSERTECFISQELLVENIEDVNFDKAIGKLWKMYKALL